MPLAAASSRIAISMTAVSSIPIVFERRVRSRRPSSESRIVTGFLGIPHSTICVCTASIRCQYGRQAPSAEILFDRAASATRSLKLIDGVSNVASEEGLQC
jgi:hypothetical protein